MRERRRWGSPERPGLETQRPDRGPTFRIAVDAAAGVSLLGVSGIFTAAVLLVLGVVPPSPGTMAGVAMFLAPAFAFALEYERFRTVSGAVRGAGVVAFALIACLAVATSPLPHVEWGAYLAGALAAAGAGAATHVGTGAGEVE